METILQLDIYDRWGALIYRNGKSEAGSSTEGWDGTLDGRDLDEGTFIYLASVKLVDGSLRQLHGCFLLLR